MESEPHVRRTAGSSPNAKNVSQSVMAVTFYFTPSIHRLIGFRHTINSTPAIMGRMVMFK